MPKADKGGTDLARKVVAACEKPSDFHVLYDHNLPIKEKIGTIAKEIYRADGVVYTAAAEKEIAEIEQLGLDKLPVCVAKTQYSLSDDQNKLGAPTGFEITVRGVKVSAGAGFIVVYTGKYHDDAGLAESACCA